MKSLLIDFHIVENLIEITVYMEGWKSIQKCEAQFVVSQKTPS